MDHKAGNQKHAPVLVHPWESSLKAIYGGMHAGNFSGGKLLSVATGGGPQFTEILWSYTRILQSERRYTYTHLHTIPLQHPFQSFGIHIMELPVTKKGNCYIIIFQDICVVGSSLAKCCLWDVQWVYKLIFYGYKHPVKYTLRDPHKGPFRDL